MTLDEYLNQDPPQKLPKGTVILQEEDIHVFCIHENTKGIFPLTVCYVDIHKIPEFRYEVDQQTGILWTRREDRSISRPTVFKLDPKLLNHRTFTYNEN